MKKKLLIINGHLNPGGVESSLLSLLNHLDYEKYDVDLLLLEELGTGISSVPSPVHVIFFDLHNTYGSFFSCMYRCLKQRDWKNLQMRLIFLQMKRQGQKAIEKAGRVLPVASHYDAVIAYRSGICTQLAAWAVNADQRITWWHHGAFCADPDLWKETAEQCDAVAVVSSSCKDMLAELFPSLEDRMRVIPNILDTEDILQKADAFDPHYQEDLFHIVTLSRLAPEKHIENTIAAAVRLKEEGFAFQWHLVGGGDLEDDLKKLAHEKNVEDVFLFEGSQPNPYPYLKQADLFVHPSYVESQGLVVLEALALHLPGVITRSLGPCEFIEDRVNGVLADPDAESLIEKIHEILQDRKLYESIRENAECPQRFSPNHIMQQISALLHEPAVHS